MKIFPLHSLKVFMGLKENPCAHITWNWCLKSNCFIQVMKRKFCKKMEDLKILFNFKTQNSHKKCYLCCTSRCEEVIYISMIWNIGIRKSLSFSNIWEGILSVHLGKHYSECWGQKLIVIYFSMGRQDAHSISNVFPCCSRASCPKFSQHQHDK